MMANDEKYDWEFQIGEKTRAKNFKKIAWIF